MSWDDGKHAKVKRVHLTFDDIIRSIEVEYDGTTLQSQRRGPVGAKSDGFTLSPDEYITEVIGYDKTTFLGDVITALTFKTNKKTYGTYGNKTRNSFSVNAPSGNQIAGFLGTSGNALNSIDVHFAPIPPAGITEPKPVGSGTNPSDSKPDGTGTKPSESDSKPVGSGTNPAEGYLKPVGPENNPDGEGDSKLIVPGKMGLVGGSKGNTFDDGVFDGAKKVTVGADDFSVTYIKIEYEKDGKIITHEHGTKRGELKEFVVDYPKEYITVVGGSYKHIFNYDTTLIKSLYFTLSNGFTSPMFGDMSEMKGTEFKLKGANGRKLVGFHGRDGHAIDAIGAYFDTDTGESQNMKPAKKLKAIGGDRGGLWDGGVFDGIRKIQVGKSNDGVSFVKIEYNKGSELFVGDGKKPLHGTEEFVVDPDDYITSVKVNYKKLNGSGTEIVTALIFKTFKGITSQPLGITSEQTSMFLLEGGKITGFHGSSSDVLHSIGAYMYLSSTPKLHGKWFQMEQKGKGPGPRCSHAIAMVGDKMYSFGGELKPNFHIDKHLYVFDFKTYTWSLASPNGDVPSLPCLGVGTVAIGTTLYVFGGRDGHRNYNGFYSYDTVKSEWKLITHVDNGPAPRSFHSMAADDKNVYVFGGVSKTTRLNTLHAYNIVNQKWIELPNPGESCKPRGGVGLAVVQGKIWVLYGFIGDETDDVHCFDPVASKWTEMKTSGEKPWARSVFAIAVVGKYIIISGGEIEMDPEAHLGPGKLTGAAFVLDTERLMWEKLEEGHSPRGWCASTTGSINGKKGLLMYGGKSPTNGRYDDIFFYGVDSA